MRVWCGQLEPSPPPPPAPCARPCSSQQAEEAQARAAGGEAAGAQVRRRAARHLCSAAAAARPPGAFGSGGTGGALQAPGPAHPRQVALKVFSSTLCSRARCAALPLPNPARALPRSCSSGCRAGTSALRRAWPWWRWCRAPWACTSCCSSTSTPSCRQAVAVVAGGGGGGVCEWQAGWDHPASPSPSFTLAPAGPPPARLLQKYIAPHQRDVTQVLAALVQACHELVPPDALEPVLRQLVDQFVHDRCAPVLRVACCLLPAAKQG